MNQWLLHNISLRRTLLAWARLRSLNTQNSSPGRGFNATSTNVSSRLFSPKREYQSLNTSKPLAWTRSRAQHAQDSSRPRLGKPLSPKREYWSLNPDTSRLGEKHEPQPKNETLQLSLRRDGLVWAKLAEFRLCSRTQFTKTNTKTPLNHYQHNASKPHNHALYPIKLPKHKI